MAKNESAPQGNQLAVLSDKLTQLDNYAEANNLLVLTEGKGGFTAAIAMADAMANLKAMLTDDIMAPIMKLQGSALGFKTDKDREGGYPVEVVRDVLIEATIKRFNVYGNQCNIIAGRFYATKEGFEDFFLRQAKAGKVTDLRESYSIPKVINEVESIVTASASWKSNGIADKFENVQISIRVNKGQGADATLGKAKRKMLARIYSRVTGTIITEGDAHDSTVVDVHATPVSAQPTADKASDEQKQLLKELLAGHETKANDWLLGKQFIPVGGSYLDITGKLASKIIGKPKDFLAAIGADA